MMKGVNHVPLLGRERKLLVLEVRRELCSCCGGRRTWGPGADVCANCEADLMGSVIAAHALFAERRIAERVADAARRAAL